ncbi:MAG: hypothetical protein K2W96_18395, partial [Gemmataceae bacterium]|nr:hypothetical protein [Gemmataceae bacterium]
KKDIPSLHVSPEAMASPDWLEFCAAFKVKPGEKRYEIEVTMLTPSPAEYPAEGVKVIDLETRSLLQVLFFVSHGVEVPPEHLAAGAARTTLDGSAFDYRRVLGGLFKVRSSCCRKRPENTAVAVRYRDCWYWIDERDHDTRATFALLLCLSRLEVGTKGGGAPVLTLPVSGR